METYEIGQIGARPWGTWYVLDILPKAIIKKIVVESGHRLSLQKHQYRAELWTVVQGVATVECDGKVLDLTLGQSIAIPLGAMHRLSNKAEEPLIIIELQMGDTLSESDIERFEDDYAR